MKWFRTFFKDLIAECIQENAFKIIIEIKQNPDSIDKFDIIIKDCHFGNGLEILAEKDQVTKMYNCLFKKGGSFEFNISKDTLTSSSPEQELQ